MPTFEMVIVATIIAVLGIFAMVAIPHAPRFAEMSDSP